MNFTWIKKQKPDCFVCNHHTTAEIATDRDYVYMVRVQRKDGTLLPVETAMTRLNYCPNCGRDLSEIRSFGASRIKRYTETLYDDLPYEWKKIIYKEGTDEV